MASVDDTYHAYLNDHSKPVKAINWNETPDNKDQEVWDRLTGNFGCPRRSPSPTTCKAGSRSPLSSSKPPCVSSPG